jgi:hypothetical protein
MVKDRDNYECDICNWKGHASRFGVHLLKSHTGYLHDEFSCNFGSTDDKDLPFMNKAKTFTFCFSCGTRHECKKDNKASKPAINHLNTCNAEKQRKAIQDFMSKSAKQDLQANIKRIIEQKEVNTIETPKFELCTGNDMEHNKQKIALLAQIEDAKKQIAIALKKNKPEQAKLYKQLMPVDLVKDLSNLTIQA